MVAYMDIFEAMAFGEAIQFAMTLQACEPSEVLELIKKHNLQIFIIENEDANGVLKENAHIEFYRDFKGISFLFIYDDARKGSGGLHDVTFQYDRKDNFKDPMSEFLNITISDEQVEINES